MKPHQKIARKLGQRLIAEAVGVGITAVSNALQRDSFPAKWYFTLRDVCAARGIDCPDEAFIGENPPVKPGSGRSLACSVEVAPPPADCKGGAA